MIKKFLLVFLVLSSAILVAQRNDSSPYSFFGIGEEFNQFTVEQASMGGIGVSFKSNSYLNFINPAANASLRLTTYSAGGLLTDLTLKDATGEQSGTTTSLKYIALGFPIGKKAGFSTGLQPKSSVGYALLNQVTDADNNVLSVTRYTGNGGTNRLYGAFGYEVTKGLSLGLEATFVFGTIENSILNQRANQRATKSKETTAIRGGIYKVGLQYQKELANKLQLSAGAVVQLESNLTLNSNNSFYSLEFGSSGNEILKDISNESSTKSIFNSPLKTSLGIGIGRELKWYAGFNYEFQDALQNQNSITKSTTYRYEKSNRISVGGFYLPKINSISSYWKRVTYRGGIRYQKTGLLVDGNATGNNFTSINDFGINLGLGLPLGNIGSNINLGIEYGKRGTTNNNLIQENYFNFRLSLSLNDIWFRKREID